MVYDCVYFANGVPNETKGMINLKSASLSGFRIVSEAFLKSLSIFFLLICQWCNHKCNA